MNDGQIELERKTEPFYTQLMIYNWCAIITSKAQGVKYNL